MRYSKVVRKPSLLLFDLGGVLVDWDGILPLVELTGGRLTENEARLFWLESESVRDFEKGRRTPEQFAAGVIEELQLEISTELFVDLFLSWDNGPIEGSVALLDQLYSQVPLACLSNNNPLHWPRMRDYRGFGRFFKYPFLSYEIGMVKPDPEIFEFVLATLPFEAREILFFDDNPECVTAAGNFGIVSVQAKGVREVRKILKGIGFQC
jgi:putative hydrolase of the HAD superfamily